MVKQQDRRPLGSRPEVAEFLGVPVSTLAYWAAQGLGPRYIKVGRSARYRWADVDQWLEAQAHSTGPGAA